jgi:tricorn protease-like protein
MKRLLPTALVCLLGLVALGAEDEKQSLRTELAQQQRASGYALVDVLLHREVHVVSPQDRTWTTASAKDIQKLTSTECILKGEHYSLSQKNGLLLRDNESGATQEIDAQGQYSDQCFSPDRKIVYTAGKMVRVYDLAAKKSEDVSEGRNPSWSPDGKWLGFDDGKHYVLIDSKSRTRKKLFSTKNTTGVNWSPDSRYLTYTQPGGSTGGFLFWGIKCIEPYRVWVWRVADGGHDWVQQICKPRRTFIWVHDSDLAPLKPPK